MTPSIANLRNYCEKRGFQPAGGVKELEAKGFKVEKREIIFEYDNL